MLAPSIALLVLAGQAEAQDDVELAESRRLIGELHKLVERGAWTGAERAYLELRELGQPLSAVTHLEGAQSAQVIGDADEVRSRLELAQAAGGSDIPALWLGDLATTYGQVTLRPDESSGLQAQQRPFSTDRAAAIDFAAKAVAEQRFFRGLLPAGTYFLGPTRFEVEGGDELTIDLTEGGPACASDDKATDLVEMLTVAESAWLEVDLEGFTEAMTNANAMFPCIDEEVQSNVAAKMHRFIGLQSYVNQDFTLADQAFSAARLAEPRYAFPTTMIPPGTAVEAHYGALDPETRTTEEIRPPTDGWIQLDGRLTLMRPVDRPLVAQLFDDSGAVTFSGYLWPRQPLPSYEPLPPGARAAVVYDKPGVPVKALVIGGGGAVVASGLGIYASGLASKGKFNRDDVRVDDLDRLRAQSNTLGAVGITTSAIGLALVGAGIAGDF